MVKDDDIQLMMELVHTWQAPAPVVVAHGTLLGAVRDNGPIPHDYDVDIALFSNRRTARGARGDFDAALRSLRIAGYRVSWTRTDGSERPTYAHITRGNGLAGKVDIFPAFRSWMGLVVMSPYVVTWQPRFRAAEVVHLPFGDGIVPVHRQHMCLIRAGFGRNWHIPKSKWTPPNSFIITYLVSRLTVNPNSARDPLWILFWKSFARRWRKALTTSAER